MSDRNAVGIRVTVTDTETGDEESEVIFDNYIIVTAGNHYVSNVSYGNGTTILTIKRDRGAR